MGRINCTNKMWGMTSKAAVLLKMGIMNINMNSRKKINCKVADTFLHIRL